MKYRYWYYTCDKVKRTFKTTPYGPCPQSSTLTRSTFFSHLKNKEPIITNKNRKKKNPSWVESNRKWRKQFETRKCLRTRWIWKKRVNESSNSSEALVDRYLPSWKFTTCTTSLLSPSFVPPSLPRSAKTTTSPIPRFIVFNFIFIVRNIISEIRFFIFDFF